MLPRFLSPLKIQNSTLAWILSIKIKVLSKIALKTG